MHTKRFRSGKFGFAFSLFCFTAVAPLAGAQTIWEVGMDDNGWPDLGGGGPFTAFVQENGAVNPLPGSYDGFPQPQGADNDYYFAGEYTRVIPGNGEYEPIGAVPSDEIAAERAFAGGDLELRYHFNLPETLQPTNLLAVTFDIFNLDGTAGLSDPRFGIEVWVNGVKVQDQIVIRPAQLDQDYTTPAFTLASVNAEVGPGADNIVSLRGISYSGDGGGNWMGIDYVRLDQVSSAVPNATLPWYVGMNDNAQPTNGTGGGPNANFWQENGTINPLPGSPQSANAPGGADNDYYFAGLYTNVIAGNGSYTPVGLVPENEGGAERAFANADNELRFHFNLPNNLIASDQLVVSFDPLTLDTSGADPRYGIEVLFNNVLVQTQLVIRPADLNRIVTTAPFTLASVNAGVGPGFDNIVTLRGINYSSEGGGNWMGFDFVSVAVAPLASAVPWSAGLNDNDQPTTLNGGGVNAAFVQENGVVNPLPGSPVSTRNAGGADNDYYFAGIYNTVISSNGNYTPVGVVSAHEDAAERAFAGTENELRFHFNLPATVAPTDEFTISYEALSLDQGAADPRYGVEVYVNGVKVQDENIIRPDDLNRTFFTPSFTAQSVGLQPGIGFDNIVTLRGINYSSEEGGNWMGFDFIQFSPVQASSFPWMVGRDDNTHLLGTLGGGPNTAFVQESGSNPPPGSPTSPQVNGQADDDYYFAGIYTNLIPSNVEALGEYEPAGVVVANEQVAERAFAGSDNEKRYHFNLPETLQPTDELIVLFDANSLDTSEANFDPHYGVEIYFNNVLVQPEIRIDTTNLDRDFATAPFTLESVNARTGPGWDNIVTLRGINHNAEGGGNWMGIDYVQLAPLPTPVFPIAIGRDDNGWPVGDGGGPNATFVQETGVNDLPGNANGREVAQGADDDYYLAGVYTNIIDANGFYEPIGIVPFNEEAAERAFAGVDNEKRYHFNLPSTLQPTNQLTVTFDAFNLHIDPELNPDPRYGVEVWFNGVQVMQEVIIRTNDLDRPITTAPFTLESVNARTGLGYDNILTLRGINYSADGGGNWMGIDYVQINGVGMEEPEFTSITSADGRVTMTWTGGGTLESAPTVTGPWTPVAGAASPYSETIVTGENRFYRLRR